jgi:acetyl-CoA acetyltransferase
MTGDKRGTVAIAGVGHSQIGRRLERPVGLLALDACLAAIEDAGLSPDDIDGMTTYPHMPAVGHGQERDGEDIVSVGWMVRAMGSRNIRWWVELAAGNVGNAIGCAHQALVAGLCDYALVWRALHMPKTGGYTQHTASTAAGASAYTAPYGATLAPLKFAPAYMRYLKMFGAERWHLGTFVVSSRQGATLNPKAVFHDKPMTVDDYMNSRMIADPVCLLDCDIPVDGAAAIVLTRSDRARDLRHPPAYISAIGQSAWDTFDPPAPEEYWHTAQTLGELLWQRSGLGPRDMAGAMLYDGFSPNVYFWLEGLGFCGRGEAYEWIQDGRIELSGELPINTFGGNLSEGRLHGMGHWVEAALQVQGRAAKRQIAGVTHVLVTTGMTGRAAGAIVSREVS